MFAPQSIAKLAAVICTLIAGVTSTAAQQTPSQRYQPLAQPNNHYQQSYSHSGVANQRAQSQMPPSVHVPPSNARQLSAPSTAPTGYRFSDSEVTNQNPYSQPNVNSAPYQRGAVMQTTYEVPSDGEPAVPEILSGGPKQTSSASPSVPATKSPTASSSNAFGSAPTSNSRPTSTPAVPRVIESNGPTTSSPAQFSNQMQQIRNNSPRIAPQEFSGNSNQIRQQFDDLQQQVAQRQQDKATQAASFQASSQTSASQQNASKQTIPAQPNAAPQPSTPRQNLSLPVTPDRDFAATANPTRPAASGNLNSQTTSASQFADPKSNESASEFISKLNRNTQPVAVDHQVQPAGGTTTMQSASPATMYVTDDSDDSRVQPASAELDTIPNASIRLSAPSISVETFGPQTVGINKPSVYKVVISNSGNITADRVLVGIDVPAWIDIENVNLTAGEKELTDGKQQSRLIWKVDQISSKGSQTITITTIPRKAETFDLGIEWSLAPRAGTANIQVTQPKLEMSIVGPDEVQYGEQALYHVTVRNPGTGAAENVVVMLPEALGGERASLGNIPAGKDKNFQVELLARTAGKLDLIATAVAEGKLEAAASRKLNVRRANLNIAIAGPSLKYAGSQGQYLVTITNNGDATAHEIIAAMALPTGVQFLGGIESFKLIDGGLRWQVGSLDPGQKREYKMSCQLDTSGELQVEVGAQGKGDLQAASACVTRVETVADLVLSVTDPKGPLPTGQSTMYEITIRNRGSRSAKGVNVVMQFSEGIEPKSASGLEHKLVPGQVLFAPIAQIEPGQEIKFKVDAEAFKPGTHVFRAQLVCDESDSREIAEGTTKFFGDEIRTPSQNTANQNSQFGGGSQDFNGVKR